MKRKVADFKKDIDKFLRSVGYSKVRSLQEIIDFNIEHADIEMPIGEIDEPSS